MNIGQKIKLQRLKRHMTQQQLAKGICSTSYLSKIEKNHVVPKQEIKNALFKRLDIQDSLFEIDEQTFMHNIQTAYHAVLSIQTKEHARIAYNTFYSTPISLKNPQNFYTTNLYLCYFSIIAEEPLENVQHLVNGLLAIKDNFTPYQNFLYHAIYAKFLFKQNKFEEAKSAVFKAFKVMNIDTIEEIEYATLLALEGRIHFRQYEHGNAFSRTRKALDIFLNNHAHEQILKTYNFLGLINLQFGNYEYALKFLNTGYDYAVQLAKKHHYGQLLQNIGYTYARMQESKRAIHYYRQSLKNKKDPMKQLITIHSLVKEYSKVNQTEQITKWCNYGLALINKHGLEDEARSYHFHFHIYPMLHDLDDFKPYCLENAIQHFSAIKDDRNVQKYALVLAEKYEALENYKKAVSYYHLANEASFSVRAIKAWQDL